ncbi:Imm49 family immunity protein [Amphibiibacter pelophylacis]|uniref:Imm49 family immunity protein n=1 Tax=Amphibiibacter pelophylacis TaxID=1799477 RepID=A0ACC6NZI4_9BURK
MNLKNYEKIKSRGVFGLLNFMTSEGLEWFETRNHMLETGQGSRSGCLGNLSSDCLVRSMLAYFRDDDTANMKQWAYLAAKARIMCEHDTLNDYLTEDLLSPLIGDNEEVIDWYRQFKLPYELSKSVIGGDKDDPKNWMFYRYQSWLALNARWDELGERCERILGMQEQIKKDRSYLIDHRFYLALAKGDKAGMTSVLLEKVSPRERKIRQEQQSGVTWNLIDSYAVIFAKLAWRAGYELDLDTPWIPRDWLPVKPLPHYEEPWPFMRDFNIWQPFSEPYAHLSPKRPQRLT